LVPEGEFKSQTIYVDMVERLEHLSSSKEVKLYLNTGWLLFSDIDTIESLMRSKKSVADSRKQYYFITTDKQKLPPKM
jgi:hypothetical protein